ncbi:MAG: NUDIX hydrolase [Candidatus Micrarchaeales archaeon]|jgi:ADP-ribose pyrophosphatase YjhB (NUDIX family)|uniref:NUDIX hydrolase n=1 Tax=Candidatus Micrarchaeum acidiphilum ARMAN-2 TaxID=425595 RepID=C7DG00_MICA2|nr:MAG: NUDIX hydrolase [Candidatus Micrarchaeum acidiphilum ARMAN-2]MCW6161457.1 NUDIX hydrolase [Candidatus Micrarchaeales archaeon]
MGGIDKGHVGAYVCVFNEDFSEMLLLWRKKEKRDGIEIKGWGNAGGTVESNETPIQACVREVREETGIALKPEGLVPVGLKKAPDASASKWSIYFFAAPIDGRTDIKLNPESRGYGWFGRDELPEGTLDTKEEILGWWSLAERAFKISKL